MSRASQVVVLAEDDHHQRLLRRYLYYLNYSSHEINFKSLPNGRGCGEQWVRERYPSEVRNFRNRAARARSALIVAIDSDLAAVDKRQKQLAQALGEENLAPRREDEAIVHVIPKRNVETWILCLAERHVDEATDYRRDVVDTLIGNVAAVLFAWTRPNFPLPPRCVPSLAAAIPELKRLELDK